MACEVDQQPASKTPSRLATPVAPPHAVTFERFTFDSDGAATAEPAPAPSGLAAWRGRLIKLTMAAIVLAVLYRAADWRAVLAVLASLDGLWLAAAFGMFVPQTLVSAWRWQGLAAGIQPLSLVTALRQTLAASALNLVVPSKLGDLSKAGMLPREAIKPAAGLVVLEKGSDVAALLVLLGLGWLGADGLVVATMAGVLIATALWGFGKAAIPAGGRLGRLLGMRQAAGLASASLLLWMLHLAQFDLFLRAAGVHVSATEVLARVPVAIFAGLVPLTLWGIGTRDGAMMWLFADVTTPAVMAGVGLLTAMRYLVPGLAGIPCLRVVWAKRTGGVTD